MQAFLYRKSFNASVLKSHKEGSVKMTKHPTKSYATVGCCGLDCGLCPRYYTLGSSRCPGCCGLGFFDKHPSCSYITCCVKKKELETCALCNEFPCFKFESLLDNGEVYDSFLTYKKVKFNLDFIRKEGLERFVEQQKKRIVLLEKMLKSFDNGRSKSFYCIAATLLPIENLEISLDKTKQKLKAENISYDYIIKSKVLRETLSESAARNKVELRLRKKGENR